ncbi:MAG: membrane protein insertase YidC [Aquificae bacterium]|nr:membrane protein insertase YidC [Aquificota bacterium]
MMDNDTQFWKRFLVFTALLFAFILGYQLFMSYYVKPTPPQRKAEHETKEEVRVNLPQLMLGSFREKQEYKETTSVQLGDFSLEIAHKGGKILRFVDRKYGYDVISNTERTLKIYPLEIFTGEPELDRKINFGEYEVKRTPDGVEIKHKELGIKKTLRYNNGLIELSVEGLKRPFWVFIGSPPDDEAFYTHVGTVLKINGEVLRLDTDELRGINEFTGNIEFGGEESRYFFKGAKTYKRHLVYKVNVNNRYVTLSLFAYESPEELYYGAKDYARLRELGLEDVIDWGTLKIIVKPLFKFLYWIYEHTGSWVVAIVVLTLIVRILLFPLGYKSTVSMLKLQELAPRVEKIKQKYKDDPVKMQEEMMKLYAETGFNPMSGCLPILLQIPIFFALYKVLVITVDLKISSFLWIPSLAEKDPYYILPILMGLTMILQQKLTPSPDPKQSLVGYVMAIAFTLLFMNFPAGLVLYWTLNNILNIVQNYIIKDILLKDRGRGRKKQGRG